MPDPSLSQLLEAVPVEDRAVVVLAWAIQHDQRPRHAGDKETP